MYFILEVLISEHQILRETMVVDNNWRRKHWNAISLNYAKAPYFKNYKDIFENLYLNGKEECLSEINIAFFKTIFDILGIKTKMTMDTEYKCVASARLPSLGKAKSQGVNTADCAYCMSILCTRGKLPTLPAIAT